MKFNFKSMLILLLLSVNNNMFCGPAKQELSGYDEFVLRNKLMQDICSLLEGKSDETKEEIIKYIYNDAGLLPFPDSVGYADKTNLDEIRKKVHNLLYNSPRQAEELQQLISACLKSLPGRGLAYTWNTILYCFKLSEAKLFQGK